MSVYNGAVITTLGAIDDGSGGRHSALFTPLLLLVLHRHPHSGAAAPERYNFESFDLSFNYVQALTQTQLTVGKSEYSALFTPSTAPSAAPSSAFCCCTRKIQL